MRQNYLVDLAATRLSRIDDAAMRFSRSSTHRVPATTGDLTPISSASAPQPD
jgi:hypothetical protein